jgi:hypothetical protein
MSILVNQQLVHFEGSLGTVHVLQLLSHFKQDFVVGSKANPEAHDPYNVYVIEKNNYTKAS